MNKLVINADDFGLTEAVSDSIIKVFQIGNLSSTTILVNMPASFYALDLARKHPSLGLGLHFNITEGNSIVGKSSLTNENGFFLSKMNIIKKILLNKINLDDINKELYVQYQYLEKAQISVSHIDSHQHIHMNPKIFKLVADFAKRKNIFSLNSLFKISLNIDIDLVSCFKAEFTSDINRNKFAYLMYEFGPIFLVISNASSIYFMSAGRFDQITTLLDLF